MTSSCFTTNYIVTPEPWDTPPLDSAQVIVEVAEATAILGRPAYAGGAMAASCWRDHPLPAPPGAAGTPAGGPTGVLAGGPAGTPSGGPVGVSTGGPVGTPRGADRRAHGRACRNTLGWAAWRARGGPAGRSRVGRRGRPRVGRPGYWQVDQRECCRAVPPERCREPPVSRSQPTPPSTSCPGTPNVRRHAQPLHRHAATGQRQPWDRPGRPASRRTREVQCNRRRRERCFDGSRRADSWQRARWRTPTPPPAGSPLAPPSSPLPQRDRRTVADPCTQSRPLARGGGQLPGRHRPFSPRQRRRQEGSGPRHTPPRRQLRHDGDDNLRAANGYELQHRGDPCPTTSSQSPPGIRPVSVATVGGRTRREMPQMELEPDSLKRTKSGAELVFYSWSSPASIRGPSAFQADALPTELLDRWRHRRHACVRRWCCGPDGI